MYRYIRYTIHDIRYTTFSYIVYITLVQMTGILVNSQRTSPVACVVLSGCAREQPHVDAVGRGRHRRQRRVERRVARLLFHASPSFLRTPRAPNTSTSSSLVYRAYSCLYMYRLHSTYTIHLYSYVLQWTVYCSRHKCSAACADAEHSVSRKLKEAYYLRVLLVRNAGASDAGEVRLRTPSGSRPAFATNSAEATREPPISCCCNRRAASCSCFRHWADWWRVQWRANGHSRAEERFLVHASYARFTRRPGSACVSCEDGHSRLGAVASLSAWKACWRPNRRRQH